MYTSDAIGTVELTGLDMMPSIAWGQFLSITNKNWFICYQVTHWAAASLSFNTIVALVLNKSSRVIPWKFKGL